MVKQTVRRLNTMQKTSNEAENQGFDMFVNKTRKQNRNIRIKRSNSINLVRQEAKNQGFKILTTRTRKTHSKPVRLIQILSFKLRNPKKRMPHLRKIRQIQQKNLTINQSSIETTQNLNNNLTTNQIPIQNIQNLSNNLTINQSPIETTQNLNNNIMQIEENTNQKSSISYKICLGWITKCDVDASILMYDENQNLVDYVSYRQLKSNDNSCLHSGDDQQGKNQDGDNEVITIDMSKLNKNIKSIWPVMNVYSGFSSFKNVSGAYCRILDQDDKVIKRMDLHANCWDNASNGCIMGKLTVDQDKLTIQPKGLYTKNTRTCQDMINTVKQVENNNFENITIRETYFNV